MSKRLSLFLVPFWIELCKTSNFSSVFSAITTKQVPSTQIGSKVQNQTLSIACFFFFFSSFLYSQSFTFFCRTAWSHVSVWWSDKWSIFEMMNLQEHNSSTVAVSCVLFYLTVKDYGIWSYHFMANRRGKSGSNDRFYFLGFQNQITEDDDWSHEIKRCLLLGRKSMTNLDSILKSRDHFTNKGLYSQSYGFSSSHVWTWELDHKEGWVLEN